MPGPVPVLLLLLLSQEFPGTVTVDYLYPANN
jgi:hypothetical protein